MEQEKISIFNKQGETLIGIKDVPEEKKKKNPTVLLVHGFGVTKEEGGMFDEIAKELVREGILVYRFDFSGCGESDGEYSETSLSKLSLDLLFIIKFIQSEKEVDNSRIGILAQSFGTAVTVARKPQVKCLIMMGSVSHPKEVLVKAFGKNYNPNGISTRRRSTGLNTEVGPQFWKDFENYNLVDDIKEIHGPILFIHGEKDEKVSVSEMEAYFKNANKPKKKVVIKGADHGLRPHREEMNKIVRSWFVSNL
jgi:pimeloyl-ACP methyl ester carboxylesterase